MKYLPLLPELFTGNRSRFVAALPPGAIAIFVSNDEATSNGDAHYPFRQNSDLFWLSGIQQEDSMVILFPEHPDARYREVLVLVRPNEMKEKWDGRRLRAERDLTQQALAARLGIPLCRRTAGGVLARRSLRLRWAAILGGTASLAQIVLVRKASVRRRPSRQPRPLRRAP